MIKRTEKDLLAGVLQRAFNGAYQTIYLDNPEERREALIVAQRIEKIAVDMGYSVRYQMYTTGSRRGKIYRAEIYFNSDRQVLPEESLISEGMYDESSSWPLLQEEKDTIRETIGLLESLLEREGQQ